MSYRLVFAKQAVRDARKLKNTPLAGKAKRLLALLASDPFQAPPPFEKLVGDLEGAYSRRINVQHRVVYAVHRRQRVVKILRLWTHYE